VLSIDNITVGLIHHAWSHSVAVQALEQLVSSALLAGIGLLASVVVMRWPIGAVPGRARPQREPVGRWSPAQSLPCLPSPYRSRRLYSLIGRWRRSGRITPVV